MRGMQNERGRPSVAILIDYVDASTENLSIPGGSSALYSRLLDVEEALEILYGPPSVTGDGEGTFRDALAHDLRQWDRYDYLDATSNWKAPFARGSVGANNGVPLPQLLGYRAILTDSGSLESFGWPEDWNLMVDWLTAVSCDGNVNVQGLIMNGDNMGVSLRDSGTTLLSSHLGAGVTAQSYNEDTSGGPADENFCVNLDAPGSALYGTSNSTSGAYTYDAWGNWCPNQFTFNVFETQSAGVGNRVYTNIATFDETQYAQVATEVVGGGSDNYRTVIDGVSWIHMSTRSGVIGDPQLECSSDSAAVVTAAYNEIASALEWVFGGVIPGLTVDPCNIVDVDGQPGPSGSSSNVSQLVGNTPNPFNPRTVVRFDLATGGKAQLCIYDTSGRLVRTLVDDAMTPGPHRATWDGTDDQGRRLPAGVYWSQLSAPDGYTSSKRMVIIR